MRTRRNECKSRLPSMHHSVTCYDSGLQLSPQLSQSLLLKLGLLRLQSTVPRTGFNSEGLSRKRWKWCVWSETGGTPKWKEDGEKLAAEGVFIGAASGSLKRWQETESKGRVSEWRGLETDSEGGVSEYKVLQDRH